MKKTWKLKNRKLFVKLCESREQADIEFAAMEHVKQLGQALRTTAVRWRFARILVFELIPGPTLEERPEAAWITRALQTLAAIRAAPVPAGVMNHYHGESLRNRLLQEQEFIGKWPGIDSRTLDVIHTAISRPELSRASLQEVAPVLGHGDYRAGNLLCMPTGEVAPVDWVDFGLCDPRYECAHLLNSLDDVVESGTGIGHFANLARWVLDPDVDEAEFRDDLRLGEIIDRIITAGNKARGVLTYGQNTRRTAVFEAQIRRLESLL